MIIMLNNVDKEVYNVKILLKLVECMRKNMGDGFVQDIFMMIKMYVLHVIIHVRDVMVLI